METGPEDVGSEKSPTTPVSDEQVDMAVPVLLKEPDSESSEGSEIDEDELLSDQDELTKQLAAAGTVGVAAAAAIATVKKRGRSKWTFEVDPTIRKRTQTRLIKKMNRILGELQSRVRLQAVVLTISPGKPPSSNTFQVYGASPLNGVIKNHQDRIVQELESHLKKVELTATVPQDSTDDQVQRLPSLVIDGIPTPLNKMTNWQLRAFIPQMLKCSEGRPRPGWGKDHMKPVWWPDDVPWKNVRHADMRSDSEKELKSFRDVLRSIVRNCYKHHNEMDLLLEMGDLNDNGKAGSASSPEVGSELGMPDLPQIPDPPEETEQVTLDSTQHPKLIQNIQGADHELAMPGLPQQPPDPAEQMQQVFLNLTQHPELIQNIQATDHELGMPDLPQIPDPSEQTEQVTLDLTQHPELIQNVQAADHELGMPDLLQPPDPAEQMQKVFLDLTQHPELMQHIQAAISLKMLSPQYLESTQLVPASLIKPGSVSTEAQVALSAAVSSHQSSATIAGVGSADDTDGLSNHGAPACEMDEEPDTIHLQARDDNMQWPLLRHTFPTMASKLAST